MLTKAQEYLLKGAKEQLALGTKEIDKLYKNFYEAKKENLVRSEVLEGYMHTIGYWEGVKASCISIIQMLEMTDYEFRSFEFEQERINIHNEEMKKEIIKQLNKEDIYAEKKKK